MFENPFPVGIPKGKVTWVKMFKNFRAYGSAVGMISLTELLSQHHFVRMQF